MIRSLRKKFVIVALVAFVVTILIVVLIANVAYSTLSTQRADATIEMIYENNGTLLNQEPDNNELLLAFQSAEETVRHTRYFTVSLDSQGNISTVDTEHISSVDNDTAITLVQEIMESNRIKGYDQDYRFCVFDNDDGSTTVIVMDCLFQKQAGRDFAAISFIVTLVMVLIALAILIPLSKIAVQPFAKNLARQQRFVTDASHDLKTPIAIIGANVDLMEAIVTDNDASSNTDDTSSNTTLEPDNKGETQSQSHNASPMNSTTTQLAAQKDDRTESHITNTDDSSKESELMPWLESTRAQVSRLNSLVGDLIELSRSNEGRGKQPTETVDLTEIVSQASLDFDALSATKGLSLQSLIASEVRVEGHTEGLSRVCGILLDNAIKYCDADGQITITLKKKYRNAVLEVSNPCSSASAEQTNHFFDRFWRANEARTHKADKATSTESHSQKTSTQQSACGGYGLGLPIAQSIIANHKGKIDAHLENHTVVITVTLPLKQ